MKDYISDSNIKPDKSIENNITILRRQSHNNLKKPSVSNKIEFNRLINKEAISSFIELIKCKLCFNVLINPFDCESCGNTFCYECINNLRVNNKQCLFKCENFQIKQASLGITSLLSTLTFECLNKESGCNTIIPYLDVNNHDKECQYQTAICPNFKCNRSIKRQLLEYHIRKECNYTLFKCDNCEINFIRADYVQHVKNCKFIEDIFDLKTPIINNDDQLDLQDMSLKNFMKTLLYNMTKNQKEFDKKLSALSEEVKSIKEVVNKQTNNTMILIENLHSEIDYIIERLIAHDFNMVINEKNTFENVINIVDDPLKQNAESTGSNTHSKNPSNNSSGFNSASTNKTVKTEANENVKPSITRIYNPSQFKNPAESLPIQNINSNVKKIKLESKPKMLGLTTNKGNKSPPNKSPNARSPKSRSPINHLPNTKTLYFETESSNSRTGNIALLKSTLKNQEIILENFNKVMEKVDRQEKVMIQRMENYNDELKNFIKFFLIEKNDFDNYDI